MRLNLANFEKKIIRKVFKHYMITLMFLSIFECHGNNVNRNSSENIRADELGISTGSNGVSPVKFKGSCLGANPMGNIESYDALLKIKQNSLKFIRVRSCPVWDTGTNLNVLGTIPTGITIPANGPLKNFSFSAGIGYAVPLQDLEGKYCRGYVSATVVKVISNSSKSFQLPKYKNIYKGKCVCDYVDCD
ncbi:MAG: hypothetical protein ABUK01_18425 [Leptospirales bacterium]